DAVFAQPTVLALRIVETLSATTTHLAVSGQLVGQRVTASPLRRTLEIGVLTETLDLLTRSRLTDVALVELAHAVGIVPTLRAICVHAVLVLFGTILVLMAFGIRWAATCSQ